MRGLRWFLAVLLLVTTAAPSPSWAQNFGSNGGTPYHYLTTASTNAQLVKGSQGIVASIIVINTTATLYYLKFYDTATAPTCNSTAVVHTIPIPFGTASSGSGAVVPVPIGIRFLNGIGFCVTGGLADTDNTNAATGVAVNLVYQ